MKQDYLLRAFPTARSFELWLSRNHAKADGIRIKIAKKASGFRSINYAEALEIALCFGWIDGQSKSIDDKWYSQRFTPRRARKPVVQAQSGHRRAPDYRRADAGRWTGGDRSGESGRPLERRVR